VQVTADTADRADAVVARLLTDPREIRGNMRLRAFIATLAVVGLVSAACGDDDDDDAAPDTTAPAAETAETGDDIADTGDDMAETGDDMAEGDALLQDVPRVETAKKVGEEDIQEGGVHIWGTVAAGPADALASDYAAELPVNGWTIEGSGGDPTGQFSAGVQATSADGRYLSLNISGPVERPTFADLCVWPAKPDDTNCPQADQQDDGDDGGPPAEMGFIPDGEDTP
jgi:hypothetical protein